MPDMAATSLGAVVLAAGGFYVAGGRPTWQGFDAWYSVHRFTFGSSRLSVEPCA
jgi:hypothetical protein